MEARDPAKHPKCTGQSPSQRMIQLSMSVVLKLKKLGSGGFEGRGGDILFYMPCFQGQIICMADLYICSQASKR